MEWNFINNSPLLTASLMATVMGFCMSLINNLFKTLNKDFFLKRFRITLNVRNDSEAYDELMLLMSTQQILSKSKQFSLRSLTEDKNGTLSYGMGYGSIYLFKQGRIFCITREAKKEDSKSISVMESETLSIIVYFGNLKHINQFLKDLLKDKAKEDDSIILKVGLDCWWTSIGKIPKRHRESIFLPDKLLDTIENDIDSYSNSRAIYESKNLKWKRGYLFYGKPGTGKSSLAHWVASKLNFGIYVLNLKSIKSESDFHRLFVNIPEKSVVLIEDVDTFDITHKRTKKSRDNGEKVGLSSILNTLDGVLSRSGLVVVMTTNHLNKLDKALIRPGRIDVMMEIPVINEPLNHRMAEWYLGTDYLNLLGSDKAKLKKLQPGVHMLTPIQKAFGEALK